MKKVFIISLLLMVFAAASVTITKAQDETLTNQDVITMTKAGLDKMVIIGKIRTSKGKYDLSTNGLIELKKEGVDDVVVHTMLEANSGGFQKSGPAAGIPVSYDLNDPAAPHDFGIYLYDERDGKRSMTRLDPSVSAQNRTGGKVTSQLTPFGLGKVKQKANLPGIAAKMQITGVTPVFYFYLDAKSGGLNTSSGVPSTTNEFALVKFNIRDDNRELTISKSNSWGAKGGLSDESVMEFTAESLGNGVFKVVPKLPLKIGEYGFYLLNSGNSNAGNAVGSKFFDFGVQLSKY
jgi:hypothetical protein